MNGWIAGAYTSSSGVAASAAATCLASHEYRLQHCSISREIAGVYKFDSLGVSTSEARSLIAQKLESQSSQYLE
jgi:hypothetical protein